MDAKSPAEKTVSSIDFLFRAIACGLDQEDREDIDRQLPALAPGEIDRLIEFCFAG